MNPDCAGNFHAASFEWFFPVLCACISHCAFHFVPFLKQSLGPTSLELPVCCVWNFKRLNHSNLFLVCRIIIADSVADIFGGFVFVFVQHCVERDWKNGTTLGADPGFWSRRLEPSTGSIPVSHFGIWLHQSVSKIHPWPSRGWKVQV